MEFLEPLVNGGFNYENPKVVTQLLGLPDLWSVNMAALERILFFLEYHYMLKYIYVFWYVLNVKIQKIRRSVEKNL